MFTTEYAVSISDNNQVRATWKNYVNVNSVWPVYVLRQSYKEKTKSLYIYIYIELSEM